MKVAIYQAWIRSMGGMERVLMEIVKRGRYDYTIFTSFFEKEKTFKEFGKMKVIQLRKGEAKGFLARGARLVHLLTDKVKEIENYDALLVSTGGLGEFFVMRNNIMPSFAFCHTPLRIVHDKLYAYERLKGKNVVYKGLVKTLGLSYYWLEKLAWSKFIRVFANSQNTKKRLVRSKLVKEEKVKVLHPGVDTKVFKPKNKWQNYFLVPGRINKYKRQLLAIEAFKAFSKKFRNFKLVLAGQYDKSDEYAKLVVREARKNKNIIVKGSVNENELVKLYQHCYAVLFTPVNEDWGLVPLEANACGKLVISVNEGGPRESIKNGVNGFLVNANPYDFAEKMEFLVRNEWYVQKQAKVCRNMALKYDWDNFVKGLEREIKRFI